MHNSVLIDKYEVLKKTIKSYQRVAVAFSGGVDSTFLLYTAKEALGDQVLAITSESELIPEIECREARAFCETNKIRQLIIHPDIMRIDGIAENPPNRCYLCKKNLFSQMKKLAEERGFFHIIEGSNADDMGDFRPGLKALEEIGILSPLKTLSFTKKEIRSLSHALNLPTWEKPSYACLATRIPYGESIDKDKLKLVEQAEAYLRGLGFNEVRVRVHNTVIARIELNPNDFSRFMRGDIRLEVNHKLKALGFAYVSLDLQGYRTGSLNEILPESI